ncbi:MAG: hypothetical protein ACYDHN_15685 [Solirubrobacteraceae bacterium]
MRLAALTLSGLCALVLASCGDTVQQQPVSHSLLETLVVAPYPVYWLGSSFEGMAITEATHDPSGAFTINYGDCIHGGQGVCVPPLRIVSSPDNSFLPGGTTPTQRRSIRGSQALIAQAGRAIVIPTAGVVVDIYGDSARLASAAARMMVPINAAGAPEAPLPARLPDSGFAATPLASQMPSPLAPLR